VKFIIKICLSVVILLLPIKGISQNMGFDIPATIDWDTTSVRISSSSYGHYGSTFLDGKMVDIFRFGGFIDEGLKQETINRLNKGNQLGIAGGEYRSTWEYIDPSARILSKFGYYVRGELGGIVGVFAAKDLVPFVLTGNADFVGDTAFFAPSELINYAYQKVGFGINQNNRLKIGLSLLNFSQFTHGRIENGFIAVRDSFDQMAISVRGRYMHQDTAMVSFFNRAGMGIGLDMEVQIPMRPTDTLNATTTPHFVVGFKNLGAYISNKNTQVYDVRSNYTFSGFEINSLQQFESSLFAVNSMVDSLRPIPEIGRQVELLPFELYFYMPTLAEGKRIQPVAGFRYINRSVLRAMGYLGAEWRSADNQTLISTYVTAGGFTRFQWGMSVRHDFGAIQLGFVTNNMMGWVSKEAYGKSLGITLNYKLACGTKSLAE
jgi:hypothetical protein